MAIPTPTVSPGNTNIAAPVLISRELCMGDSLPFINGNTDYFNNLTDALQLSANSNVSQIAALQSAVTTFVAKAGDTMSGNLNMGANKVTSSSTPSDGSDLTNKTYVDNRTSAKVDKAGDSMTGTLNMGANKVTSSSTPSDGSDLTNKTYVDAQVGTRVPTSSPAVAKAWATVSINNTTGAITKLSGYNVDSIIRASGGNDSGQFQINFSSGTFSNANYAAFITTLPGTNGHGTECWVNKDGGAKTSSYIKITTYQVNGAAYSDPVEFYIVCFG